ncbi:hypothetical protein [Saliphagus sp. LR7]|uniref:hypothetical protein n=1 Tax=Saliphagus sp. LR7 TaxID=2282654 RepID=UPI000DF86182|nr:hypothetical protein [Saliphagus sp. LR7]
MGEEVKSGDQVEIAYESTRSGNVVSRTGTVVQTPDGNERSVLFVETDENQLTGVTAEYAFSVSTGGNDADADDDSTVQRTVSLGPLASVTKR